MDYHAEIFAYHIFFILVICYLFYSGSQFLIKKLDLDKKNIDYQERWRQEKRTNIIDTVSLWACIITVLASLIVVVFPTPLSVPTVQITKQGDIIPLPYGTWLWETTDYVRLEPTYSDCNIWEIDSGITNKGIYVYPAGAIATIDFKNVTFRFTNYAAFYKHYKTKGVYGFCNDLREIVAEGAFWNQAIYPQSTFSETDIRQMQKDFKARLLQLFTEKFQDKGIVPVME